MYNESCFVRNKYTVVPDLKNLAGFKKFLMRL